MVEELATMSEALRKSEQGRANASYWCLSKSLKETVASFLISM